MISLQSFADKIKKTSSGAKKRLATATKGAAAKTGDAILTDVTKQVDTAVTEKARSVAAAAGASDAAAKAALTLGVSGTAQVASYFKTAVTAITDFFKTYWLYILVAVFFIAVAVWFFKFRKTAVTATAAAEEKAAAAATTVATTPQMAVTGGSVAEGFQDATAAAAAPTVTAVTPGTEAPIDPSDATLLNLQPLTIKHAGFLGPDPQGEFKPDEAIVNALRSGFRSFVLQIDYLTAAKDPVKFADPGYPTLVVRDEAGALISANSGSIKAVSETIASMAFRPQVPNSTLPVLLYLHVQRAPSAVRERAVYMRFLSRIAKDLNPLAPFHLGMTPLGIFHRQKNESTLLTAPLSALGGSVIILSNADTTLFRNPPKGTVYNPDEDLDFWVNMRVYLDSDEATIGITKIAEPGVTPRAIVKRTSDLLSLSAGKSDAFAMRGMKQFTIALPPSEKDVSEEELQKLINAQGVNMVPIDIFTMPSATMKAMMEVYGNQTFRPKPAAMRKVAAA